MSLRLRLLLSLLGLAAVGLIVLDFASYSSLRSYLTKRVDQQVRAAEVPVGRALFEKAGPPYAHIGAPPGIDREGALGGAVRGEPPFSGGPPPGPPSGAPPGLGAGAFQLPPGTYGELRNASGKVISRVLFSYGEQGISRPALPSQLSPSSLGQPAPVFTARSTDSDDAQFRAAAFPAPIRSSTIAVAVPLTELNATLSHVRLIELLVSAAALAGLALLAWWLIRIGMRPLDEIAATAGEIAAGDLTRRVKVTNPRTEVGRLGLALNEMLGQIESAFAAREASEARMRRFLADASHELRTPLSSIRGYAELFRLGPARNPADLEKAMGRIEQESSRMGGLVDDLLTLARLDEVREPVREPVDLSALVAEACDDARAAAPDRRIEVEAPAALEILGDEDQLRQVVANLLANARAHTPAGTPIEVKLERSHRPSVARPTADVQPETWMVLTVRDHGPGFADGAAEQLFERFWRQSDSRSRADGGNGGAGLGLAIVAGVVAAHGGTARAENAPGGGARFVVELPVSGHA